MKNKFKRLSRKERKQAIKDFRNHSNNYNIAIQKINRVKIISVLGFIFGIFSFAFDFYAKNSIASFLLDAFVVVFCFVAFIKCNDLISTQVNQFLIDNKTKQKKSKK